MPNTERLLELALKGLEAERARIDGEISEIRTQFKGRPNGSIAEVDTGIAGRPGRKRRKMSAEARRKISEAMKRRHALMRSPGQNAQQTKPTGRGLTAAGRRKLSEMMKARWAARRKAAAKK